MGTLLDHVEFEDNPEPRCAVVLLLDTSDSMSGQPIAELNEGLRDFERSLKADTLASLRVEVAIITFGGNVQVIQSFITVDQFTAPTLSASGNTPMGAAARQGLSLLKERKERYKANGIDYFRPWMFLITDGAPTDAWQTSAAEVKQEEQRKGLLFFGVGVERANMSTLSQFSATPPMKLKGLAFRELFQWLSKSLSSVSQSRPGEQVPLPAVGWGQVDTSH